MTSHLCPLTSDFNMGDRWRVQGDIIKTTLHLQGTIAGAIVHLPLLAVLSCSPPPEARLWLKGHKSDADTDVTGGVGWAAFNAGTSRAVRVGATVAEWAQQQPEVEYHACPTRRHFHPERGPAAVGERGLQHRWLIAGGGGRKGGRGILISTAMEVQWHNIAAVYNQVTNEVSQQESYPQLREQKCVFFTLYCGTCFCGKLSLHDAIR